MDKAISKAENTKIKERSSYWDSIKGVLIILVVFAHCLYALQDKHINDLIVDSIYYFHMPAFVFVSGFFSKSERCRSRESILFLLIAYLLFMIPFIFWRTFNGSSIKLIHPYYSAWYLLALVVWRIIVPYIAKFKHPLIATVVFSVLVGFWGTVNGETAFAVNKVVTFLPYFMAGYLLSQDVVDNKIKSRKKTIKLAVGLSAVTLGFVVEAWSYKALHITGGDLLPGKYSAFNFEEPLSRIMIIIVSALFITGFLFLSTDKKIPFITMAGRNSLTIYLFHRIFTLIFSHYMVGYRARTQIIASVVCTIAIVLVFGNDFVSQKINTFIKNCAHSISFVSEETRKDKIYKIITLSMLGLTFVIPIIVKFVK